ncbi:hypothetical protein BGLA2_450011 [Burkholderia gladioli]|nr:hypothetical protein BGLA2_450011 [Burkholderia gladioli]
MRRHSHVPRIRSLRAIDICCVGSKTGADRIAILENRGRHGMYVTIGKLDSRVCQRLSDPMPQACRVFASLPREAAASTATAGIESRYSDGFSPRSAHARDHPPALRRPLPAPGRARPARAAAPQGREGRRAGCDPPHGAVADRHHPRGGAQPLPGAVQPPRPL